jgi:translocation and assembly module TamA
VSLTKRAKFILSSDPEVVRQFSLLQPQSFNSILSFTIQRDKTNDLFSPSSGFVHSVTVEEAGVLSLLLKNLFRDLPFTQFYRAIVVGRWYEDLNGTRFSVLGLKLKAGLEDKYGSSRDDSTRAIPQTHRFFAGGGGSVRGWASRALIARGDPELGGNLSVEASAELRLNLFQSLRDGWLDKIWLVFFADAGNVWPELRDFEIRKVAVAAGLGFRYDTLVGPFRIDWGFRVFDPSASPGRQWITQRQLIGQTMKEGVFHFGIGHAF